MESITGNVGDELSVVAQRNSWNRGYAKRSEGMARGGGAAKYYRGNLDLSFYVTLWKLADSSRQTVKLYLLSLSLSITLFFSLSLVLSRSVTVTPSSFPQYTSGTLFRSQWSLRRAWVCWRSVVLSISLLLQTSRVLACGIFSLLGLGQVTSYLSAYYYFLSFHCKFRVLVTSTWYGYARSLFV